MNLQDNTSFSSFYLRYLPQFYLTIHAPNSTNSTFFPFIANSFKVNSFLK